MLTSAEILVPVDFSPCSVNALRVAIAMAAPEGDLTLLEVKCSMHGMQNVAQSKVDFAASGVNLELLLSSQHQGREKRGSKQQSHAEQVSEKAVEHGRDGSLKNPVRG